MKAITVKQPWVWGTRGRVQNSGEVMRRGQQRVAGHARHLVPRGLMPGPRQRAAEGWLATCRCGWQQENLSRRQAEQSYSGHLEEMVASEFRICTRCGETKLKSEMGRRAGHLCKGCVTAKTRAWADQNGTEYERHKRKSMLKWKYGITPEEYDALLAAQCNSCAVCGRPDPGDARGFRPHVDHCHITGTVRGILCGNCNQGIGNLRDNPEILQAAIRYLLKHSFDIRSLPCAQ